MAATRDLAMPVPNSKEKPKEEGNTYSNQACGKVWEQSFCPTSLNPFPPQPFHPLPPNHAESPYSGSTHPTNLNKEKCVESHGHSKIIMTIIRSELGKPVTANAQQERNSVSLCLTHVPLFYFLSEKSLNALFVYLFIRLVACLFG